MSDAKQKVFDKYSNAYAHSWADQWVIYCGGNVNLSIGAGKTRNAAWDDAARRLLGEKGAV